MEDQNIFGKKYFLEKPLTVNYKNVNLFRHPKIWVCPNLDNDTAKEAKNDSKF
jgi:hypothetical protein